MPSSLNLSGGELPWDNRTRGPSKARDHRGPQVTRGEAAFLG